jgi:hypothetical protein
MVTIRLVDKGGIGRVLGIESCYGGAQQLDCDG